MPTMVAGLIDVMFSSTQIDPAHRVWICERLDVEVWTYARGVLPLTMGVCIVMGMTMLSRLTCSLSSLLRSSPCF